MAIVKSDIITLLDNTDPSQNKVESNVNHGRLRLAAFSFDTGASGPAVADRLQAVEVPAGARVMGIYLVHDAMSSGAGTAGANIGDLGDPDRFAAAFNMDAASTGVWVPLRHEDANLAAKTLGIGYKYTTQTRIEFAVTGEAWANNARVDGYVVYSVE